MMSKKCGGLTNLRQLKFRGYGISDINILSALEIIALSNLKHLNLWNSNIESFVTTKGSKRMSYLQNLQLGSLNSNSSRVIQSLKSFSSLKSLSYEDSDLTSPTIIYALRNLSTLEYLYLEGSSLNDNFLANIGQMTSLKVLNMPGGGNNGTLPNQDTEFQNWIPNFQLEFFAIRRCINLQKLPSFLHYQYDLRILAIEGNQLSGIFPTWLLENNTKLAAIYSRDNAFNGPFKLPSSRHLHLQTIDVSNNKINGHIPENMNSAFPKLTFLNMSQNYLEGPIPSKISGIHLKILDSSLNFLSGEVPGDLAIGSPQLFYLRLSNNKLKGKIFSDEFRPHILSFLYLNDNNFEGALPSNVFLSSLITLDASRNNFSGEIPGCIRDNRRLLQLELSKNHLQGLIPVEICNLKIINVLAISENRLSGLIPSCVSSLPLKHIHLEKNQLGGGLEHVLFNFSSLITLDLRNNNFSGNIPHTIGSLNTLNYLLLSNNKFEGEIPTQICMLNKLSIVDLSFNKIYGPLPPCLGYLTQTKKDAEISWTYYAETSRGSWLNFVVWMRSKRHYHDSHGIRRDMFDGCGNSGNMSNIHALNLSHNHLIGRIPNTFSNLQEIESLDLSCNRLNGSIPVGLLELNSLAVFSVAYNNLSGAVPDFKAQFGTFNKSSYEGNPFLCGYPLDNKCGMSPNLSNTSKINGDEESSELCLIGEKHGLG
ncbi:hypothetical protein KY290_033479 [Solanum tuberosum]|uniref:Uncharacterized protein n=1 Tax=Solanum tuberosum TaxID=4113 RepID=A0ABQ7U0U7_SOLTU|nr:hypothetical protein KY285_032725 [Solanum tuberosum]KAH0740436.1 hypothetical protein KY290_033479 [Solanum tuberosum]